MPQSRHRKKKSRSNTGRIQASNAGLNKKEKIIVLVVLLALIAAGIVYLVAMTNSGKPSSTASTSPATVAEFDNVTPSASGLKYIDVVEGTGKTATAGQEVTVAYRGTLTNGTEFDSSSKPGGRPYTFRLGTGSVIQGWHEGIAGMKVGGKRKLLIPPALGYAGTGKGQIPPNATLLFDVELVDAK